MELVSRVSGDRSLVGAILRPRASTFDTEDPTLDLFTSIFTALLIFCFLDQDAHFMISSTRRIHVPYGIGGFMGGTAHDLRSTWRHSFAKAYPYWLRTIIRLRLVSHSPCNLRVVLFNHLSKGNPLRHFIDIEFWYSGLC